MFDPDENLEVAAQIHAKRGMWSEAWIRTAVGRCYYSSLLAVRPHLGPHEDGDDLHQIAMLYVQGMSPAMGDRLRCLYNYRVRADMGSESVDWSRDLITELRAVAKQLNAYLGSIDPSGSAPRGP